MTINLSKLGSDRFICTTFDDSVMLGLCQGLAIGINCIILLGPALLGRVDSYATIFFPSRSILTLEMVAPIVIGAVSAVLAFGIGSAAALALRSFFSQGMKQISCILFLNSVTTYPLLAQIFAKTKLLNSEFGHISISVAMANNAIMWA